MYSVWKQGGLTFVYIRYSIQYCVQYPTQEVFKGTHSFAHEIVGGMENPSTNDNRVDIAEVEVSCEAAWTKMWLCRINAKLHIRSGFVPSSSEKCRTNPSFAADISSAA